MSQGLALRHFGSADPIGRRISTNRGRSWREIVGVVERLKGGRPMSPRAAIPGFLYLLAAAHKRLRVHFGKR